MMDIALNANTNDIYLDGSGVLAVTGNIVQSVVIAFRLFLGEYDFDVNIGVDWDEAFIGTISQNDFIFDLENQILLIDGIEECTVELRSENRVAYFKIQITTTEGDVQSVTIQ